MKQALGLVRALCLITAMALGLVSCGQVAGPPPAANSQPVVKLVVNSDGVYEVSAEALQTAGLGLETGSGADLALSAGGEPVSFLIVGEGRERAIRFYGQALGPAAYTANNVYWLRRQPIGSGGGQVQAAIKTRSASPATGLEPTSVISFTVRAEEQRHYQPDVHLTTDRWLWTSLFAPSEVDVSISTPHPAAGMAILRMRVWADSSAPVNPDHHLILHLNNVAIADAKWDGAAAHIITAPVRAGALHSGDNRLRIESPGDTGAPADSVLLDWVEISYPRALILDRDTLTFSGRAAGFAVGLPAGDALTAVWDTTDPKRPIALRDYRVQGDQLIFASDNTPRQYTLATRTGLRQPVTIATAISPDLRDWAGGADMIIVTVPQFRDALQPLVAARQSAGLRVAVVDVTAVYDTFTYGQADPAAIRALVHHAQSHWTPPAPRFLLLAGDASSDPRGYLHGTEADLVPTQLVRTTFTGWTASDVWYALPMEPSAGTETPDGSSPSPPSENKRTPLVAENGDRGRRPVLAVGRFPAQTVEQMRAMVAKTVAYEREDAAAWQHEALFLADNDEAGFAAEANAFAGALPAHTSRVIAIDGDGSQARANLLRAFADGVGLVGYFGHGSMNLWAKEKILSVDDIPNLANRDRLPIVFTVTCLSGFFAHPQKTSLGEALLRAPGGGAVAALVPASAAPLPEESVLSRQLARAWTEAEGDRTTPDKNHATLGDVILAAQVGLPDLSAGVSEVLLTFNLLGDPALTLTH